VGAHESPRAARPTTISPTLRNLTKAEILATGFFPPPNVADLTDLEGVSYPAPVEIPQEATSEQVIRAIKRLLLDKIIN
jgi:hypothetical protein